MNKISHPSNRLARRSIQAKALEHKQHRQRKINGKKRALVIQIESKETEDELRHAEEIGIGGIAEELT